MDNNSTVRGIMKGSVKEVPASEDLRACTFFDYLICNIPVVICKLDLVFCFNKIVNRQLRKKSSPWQGLELQLLRLYRQVIKGHFPLGGIFRAE